MGSCNIEQKNYNSADSVAGFSNMLSSNYHVQLCFCIVVVLMMNGSVISSPITEELSADTAEQARLAWNSWQDFERENLPWLYRCEGPIGLFCPGPGPDVYDIIPDLPQFPGIIPPPSESEQTEEP